MSEMYDAVFYEAFEEEEKALKKVLPSDLRYMFTWKTIQESGHEEPPSSIVSTRTQSIFPEKWSDKLKAIITRSTGFDHVTAYLTKTKVKLPAAYIPEYAARAVAEQAMLMWSGLLRNINTQQKAFRKFYRDGLTGSEICNRTITVVGVGRIGSQIVDIACGLGMKVTGVDIAPDPTMKKRYALDYVPLDEGLKASKVVVCALPLTEITRGMLNYEKLKQMPERSVFVNIARGEISPVTDLLRLLREGRLSGIGLDVYDYERELADVLRGGSDIDEVPESSRESIRAVLELTNESNVILTPHNAFNTNESIERKALRTAENLRAYIDTGQFLTPVPQ